MTACERHLTISNLAHDEIQRSRRLARLARAAAVRKFCARLAVWRRKPSARDAHAIARLSAGAAALILAVAAPLGWPASAEDADWIVVAVARDASWGMGIAASQGEAIAAARHDCRQKAGTGSDCGARTTAARNGWVIASACGDHLVVVSADTQEAAEQGLLFREIDLANSDGGHMPACRRLLTVGPAGPHIGTRATAGSP